MSLVKVCNAPGHSNSNPPPVARFIYRFNLLWITFQALVERRSTALPKSTMPSSVKRGGDLVAFKVCWLSLKFYMACLGTVREGKRVCATTEFLDCMYCGTGETILETAVDED